MPQVLGELLATEKKDEIRDYNEHVAALDAVLNANK